MQPIRDSDGDEQGGTDASAPGTRMSYWIATALETVRENIGISEDEMATSLGVNWRTIRRLETGGSMGRDIDRFVAGYAHVAGIEDGRDIWEDALARWRKHGNAPQFEAVSGPAAAFADAIRAEVQRQKGAQSRGGSQESRPGQKRKRSAS